MLTELFWRLWPYLMIAALLAAMMLIGRNNRALRSEMRRLENSIQLQKGIRDAGDAVATSRKSVVERMLDGGF